MIDSDKLLQKAAELLQSGKPAEAEAQLRRALESNPYSVPALANLGTLLQRQNRLPEAAECFRRICNIQPNNAGAFVSLGICLGMLRNFPQAAAMFQQAVRIEPANGAALSNLAHALLELGNLVEAEKAAIAALPRRPNDANTLTILATISNGLGKYEQAASAAQAALRINAALPFAQYQLGIAFRGLRRMSDAVAPLTRALELRPNYPEAAGALASLLAGFGLATPATQTIDKALAASPSNADLHNIAGFVLQRAGQVQPAIEHFRRAAQLQPNLVSADSNVLLAMHHLDDVQPQALFDEHLAWARRHLPAIEREPRFAHANTRDENRRLRIAYISPDFRYHSVAHFLRPILEQHDRTQFDIICYSGVASPDHWTRAFHKLDVTWNDIARWNDAHLASRIHADKIDIAVDCSGHTSDHRLLALARRPAPVQVTFLGYPNTTGLNAIDYRITDAVADPPGESDRLNVEKLLRLEPTAWCYAAAIDAPPCPTSRPDGPICFGSFTTLAKLTSRWITVWCDILSRVPDSRLLLKSSCLNDDMVRGRLFEQFTAAGISADRIELLRRQVSAADHLATYGRVDIALDTFPYHGTTTTCEALYMGVPVVTLAGQTHASRVGASLLSAVGLQEFIAHDQEQFIETAVRLAGDSGNLRELHGTLRQRMQDSPLMNATAYTAGLERAYRNIWRTWCRNT